MKALSLMAIFGFVESPETSRHYTCTANWNTKIEELQNGMRLLYYPDYVRSGTKIRVLILEITEDDREELYCICLPDQDVITVERSRLSLSGCPKKRGRKKERYCLG